MLQISRVTKADGLREINNTTQLTTQSFNNDVSHYIPQFMSFSYVYNSSLKSQVLS